MLPHSAIGGCTPSPRKESPASSIIMVPISRTEVTSMGPAMFGKICLNMILNVLLPDNLTAIRYGESFWTSVRPLASLANFGHPITARAMIAFWIPPPSTPATASAKTRLGNARKRSDIRIRIVSAIPPHQPQIIPIVVPTTVTIATRSNVA